MRPLPREQEDCRGAENRHPGLGHCEAETAEPEAQRVRVAEAADHDCRAIGRADPVVFCATPESDPSGSAARLSMIGSVGAGPSALDV
jgi:hypothetical protein